QSPTRSPLGQGCINTQQFKTRKVVTSRVMNEVGTIDNLRLENQLTELTSVSQRSTPLRVCGICSFMEHPTNMCPTLQETKSDNVEGNIQPRDSDPPKAYFELEQLSAANSKISGTIIPLTTATTSSTMGQFTFSGRMDEADEQV
ncbi:hypothetical protein CR513_09852, partial [Mucuna pruriens]